MTKQIHEALRSCLQLSAQVQTGKSKRNKSQLEREDLKYKETMLRESLKYLDMLISKNLTRKEI